ncbi:melatonin-related receptor isoform X2 [Oenanthe melanoleuca]|uniref:melatonin-related receptor isoform X2 n=1 Tax=Oenanthe melanoleuca TaxID=2939378 RepID=UPI0024C0E904|nr:melatonin-related receptor isoform X2 [Oenanthe melanoleuca]
MERPGSNESCPGCRLEGGPAVGAATGLAAVLIFTIVVDVLGNALVILSVLRNKKLRNAGEREACARGGRSGRPRSAPRAPPPRPRMAPLLAGREPVEGGESRTAVPHRGGEGTSAGEPRFRSALAKGSELSVSRCSARPSLLSGERATAAFPTHSLPVPSRCCCCPPTFRNFYPPEAAANGGANSGNIFVVSLSIADLVVAVYPYPLILSAIFHNGWTMGNVHCQISGFLMGLSVIGSIFNITAIAINRYCYICHSLRYDKLFNLKNTCCYLCLTWILTVVAIVPNFFVGSLQYDPRIYSCTFAQTVSTSYTITVVVVHFIVPLSVVTFCYLRIWILVIKVKHRVRQDCKQKLRATDIRNFLTMFVVFVLFAVCWGPLNFIGLAVSINPSKVQPHIPEWLFVLSYFMAYFNSCLNAVIYGLLNQNFRKEYKRILLTLWSPRLLFIDVSKGGTEGIKSKHSPAITTNNNHAEIHL